MEEKNEKPEIDVQALVKTQIVNAIMIGWKYRRSIALVVIHSILVERAVRNQRSIDIANVNAELERVFSEAGGNFSNEDGSYMLPQMMRRR